MFGTSLDVLTEAAVSREGICLVREILPENMYGVDRSLQDLERLSQESSSNFTDGFIITVVVIQAGPFQRPSDTFH